MKRGQLELSFGVLFSVILIIVVIGAAIYFINVFVNTSDCATVQVFQKEVQDSIDSAWRAAKVEQTMHVRAPRGVSELCIGDSASAVGYASERTALDNYLVQGTGLYLLPVSAACEGGQAGKHLTHASGAFFCVRAVKGMFTYHLSKTNGTVQVQA